MTELPMNPTSGPAGEDDQPTTAAQARQLLLDGNKWFVELGNRPESSPRRWHLIRLDAADIGISGDPNAAPAHEPFAAVLGCSDARVPAELVLGRAAGDLFMVRVAGNVPGTWSIGSIDFAVDSLSSLRLVAVIGHTSCQAIGASVNAFLSPTSYLAVAAKLPLRAIVDSILPAVGCAAQALTQAHGQEITRHPGYRDALVELSVILNCALTASVLRQTFGHKLGTTLDVVYGVYNLKSRIVGLPDGPDPAAWMPMLTQPPEDEAEVVALGRSLATTGFITALLAA